MSVRKALKREMRVAFSGRAQPARFRVLKWAIAVGVSVLLWRTGYFWLWILGALGLGDGSLHLAVENQRLDAAMGRLGRSRGSQEGLRASKRVTALVRCEFCQAVRLTSHKKRGRLNRTGARSPERMWRMRDPSSSYDAISDELAKRGHISNPDRDEIFARNPYC